MARVGRHTKYTPETAAEIAKLLASGCIIEDVCAKVGISHTAYFDWLKRYPEFLESIERAKADAKVGAALSIRKAMMPHDVTSRTTKTISETRLRKRRVNIGSEQEPKYAIEEQPYTYTKTEQSETLSNEFDWRAALEYLKRRDPDNWAEHLIVRITPEQLAILQTVGLAASDVFEMAIQEIAAAQSEVSNAAR